MYKQKLWNVENMHMGVIKAFIVVSMLFVCMFSMKMSVRAEETASKQLYIKTYYTESGSDFPYRTQIFEIPIDQPTALIVRDIENGLYVLCSKNGTTYYFHNEYVTSVDRYNSSEVYCDTYEQPDSKNVYPLVSCLNVSPNIRSDWKPIETNLLIFETVEEAQYYFDTGDSSGAVNAPKPVRIPSYVNDKYIETYSLKGFECDLTVSAKWTGHTRYIPPTLRPDKPIEKIIVEGIYFNEDEPCIFDILDINTTSWSRDIEEIRVDRLGNTLQYIYFTPYYYFEDEETIYYGNRISVDAHDWSLGFGVVFDHDEYGNTYTMNNQVTDYNEDITLGYLQGVKREQEYDIGWGSGYRITWNTDNESLNDCHIQIALRGVQEKLTGPSLYNVVPYKQYKDNILYSDGNILINDLDIIKYYKDNYYNSYYGGNAGVDTVMLRLVRYDSENSKYVYGGWVNVDPSTINSEGVQTSTVDRYGNISADNTSEDSYADKSSGFNLFSKETVTSSSANIIATLDNAQKFIGDGNFDAFLKSSFSFIPSEIWTIILSGLSVIVGFLFIKLILEVL